jgi:hypothetical protein
MKDWIKRLLNLHGSWKWACKQMDNGYIIQRLTDSGQAKYKLDHEDQRRIMWTFERNPGITTDWDNAYIFLSDFEYTNWAKWLG